MCIINSYSTLLNWPIVSLLILFILFSMFFVLIHDYTLCFTGSPCCNFSYYNYIYIWPFYIVIHYAIVCSGKCMYCYWLKHSQPPTLQVIHHGHFTPCYLISMCFSESQNKLANEILCVYNTLIISNSWRARTVARHRKVQDIFLILTFLQ